MNNFYLCGFVDKTVKEIVESCAYKLFTEKEKAQNYCDILNKHTFFETKFVVYPVSIEVMNE